jgi:hypothetical protein
MYWSHEGRKPRLAVDGYIRGCSMIFLLEAVAYFIGDEYPMFVLDLGFIECKKKKKKKPPKNQYS